MSERTERIGFIGLGVMGRPMAGHLLAKGYSLVVHSRSRGPVDALVSPPEPAQRIPLPTSRDSRTSSSRCCRTRRMSSWC